MESKLESLLYHRGSLHILDQLKLPTVKEYVLVDSLEETWNVIRKMQVRGAPLIAIVAALGLATVVDKKSSVFVTAKDAADFILGGLEYLRTSRPTAVNLFVAADLLKDHVELLLKQQDITASAICNSYISEAEKLWSEDVKTNKSIGDFGANRILEIVQKDTIRVLTICNTGSLATSGYGTALGVVRSLHALGKLEHVYACETRPYNQGARLTAFEIVEDKLPGTLITDSMASALMALKGIDCVVVGADRVAANGDFANKIGTYQLAIAAKYHGIPFFTALPTTTIDVAIPNGHHIHIEERPADELTTIFGQRIAPEGIAVWNPSFDVTPCALVKGIITELGVAEAAAGSKDGVIDVPAFLREKGSLRSLTSAAMPTPTPTGLSQLTPEDIALVVSSNPRLRAIVGCGIGKEGIPQLSLDEVGDGNINFVYIVKGPTGTLVVKQALPFVRCVGEQWPLTAERIKFEKEALVRERSLSPEHVPEVFYFDEKRALLVMEYVPPPNAIIRKTFLQGQKITTFAKDVGLFAARTLFGSSALSLKGEEFRTRVSEWSRNTNLCALTEQVVFTDPYHTAQYNHWTTPQLDDYVRSLQADSELKLAVSSLKSKFLSFTQALIHGDLHTGSVMASEGTTFVIDPEFAFYGPIGFDVGAFICNLLLAYFSQPGHFGNEYAEWLLEQTEIFYNSFHSEFIALWNRSKNLGEVYVEGILVSDSEWDAAQERYIAQLWSDSLGFAGAKMIRRIVGIAHVADLETISEPELRSQCEKRALLLGRKLVLSSQISPSSSPIPNIKSLLDAAREHYSFEIPTVWPVSSV